MSARRGPPVAGNVIDPCEGGRSVDINFKSVVLPQPFGPMMSKRSLGATSRSTRATAHRGPKRRPSPVARRAESICPPPNIPPHRPGLYLSTERGSADSMWKMVRCDRKPIRQIWSRQGWGQDLSPSISTAQKGPLQIRRSNKKSQTPAKVEENLDRYVDMSTDICHDVFGLTGPNRENTGVSRYLGKF